MRKYCISPNRANTFLELLDGIDISDEQREIVACSFIRHVEIIPEDNIWEMVLETPEIFDDSLIEKIELFITKKCGLKSTIIYQHVRDLNVSIDKAWDKIVYEVTSKLPVLRPLLKSAERRVENCNITIRIGSILASELLKEFNIAKKLQAVIQKMTGCFVNVICESYDGDAIKGVDSDAVISRSEAYYMAQKCERDNSSEKAAKDNNSSLNKSPSRKVEKSSQKRGFEKHKTPKHDTAAGCIYGNGVEGEVIAIDDIESEEKNIVVIGIIERIEGTPLKKSNVNLLAIEIADATQGISAKIFFRDNDEYENAVSALKVGDQVRIKGAVKYDTFQNDFVLFPTGIKKVPLMLREDKAAEKRVELHAHTQMSAMDSVVPTKDLVCTAARWGWPAVAITDHGVVQAFPDAMNAVDENHLDIKVIYGLEGYLTGDNYKEKANHVIILAKNMEGLHNLYTLVSLSHLRFFYYKPHIPKSLLAEYRKGLIIGSACEAGELIRAIERKESEEKLLEIAGFYDYLEIQPIGNNEFLVREEKYKDFNSDDDLIKINLKVAELAKKLNKMLVATCDVHFLNPEDAVFRAVIKKGAGFDDEEQPPLFLRTTEEMLKEFEYLGKDLAYEAVVTNPRKVAEMVERIKPIPDMLYSPSIPGAEQTIKEMSYNKAHELYGGNLPEIVQARIDQELKPIIAHGFSVLYLIAQKLVKKSNDDGYLVGSRGSVGSSFIATLTGITEVNPLPPHYRCPHCKFSEFFDDGSYSSGFDLPDKSCPVCGTPLAKDGHNIPFAVFLGFDGDKVPDIDLNFSGVYQPVAHKYTEILFGKDNVYKAGSIGTVAEKTAYGYAKKYFEGRGEKKRGAYIQHIVNGCVGIKRTTGQHPAGIMVIPRDMDVHFFTPLQHPADKKDSPIITTHFDYHSISSRIVKLDILGHDDPTVIKMLEEITHRDPKTIPFDDKATLSLFNSTSALGVTPEELGATSGTFGVPEFRTDFTRQMIDDTHPKCFSDLVRISGFSHGTDVWTNNAQTLIRSGTCTLQDAISCRDDIMNYLIQHGVDRLLSFEIMEKVRKGKGKKILTEEVINALLEKGVPQWYIDSCLKIKYLFPRAHATAYVMMAYRIAFCKVHYPLAFYAAYFSIRADAFDANAIADGKEAINAKLKSLMELEKPDEKQKEMIRVLQIAREMYLRGYHVEHIDIYKSSADEFILHKKSLLPPLTSLNGFGLIAAKSIVEARSKGEFLSIEDLKKRTLLSKTNIELLKEHGCLEGLHESDQIELFAI